MPHDVTLIPGDGIGPEVAEATARAVEAAGADIDANLAWDVVTGSSSMYPDSNRCSRIMSGAISSPAFNIRQ